MKCKYVVTVDVFPNSLKDPKCESQTENNEKARSWCTLPGLQHFGGVEGVLELRDGTMNNDKR